MDASAGSPPWLSIVTAQERPDLWSAVREQGLFDQVWPAYNRHGDHTPRYFGALVPDFAHLQLLFLDGRSDRVAARARTIPFCWDGSLQDLPPGIDALGLRAVGEGARATSLSALAAEVDPGYQGEGLSRLVLLAMAATARAHGLSPLVAPVRPSRKDRYPRMAIDRYAQWRRPDGQLFDPWLRTHERIGGRILRPEPHSLQITAPVADWEAWTGAAFPGDGNYVFPEGLAPLEVAGGVGTYFEPNVWMVHQI